MMRKNDRGIRIAVVDYSASARELMVTLLQSESDFRVVGTGSDGRDAVNLVKISHPDILLIDVRMPIMDGLEVTRQIMREAPLPILLLSENQATQEAELTFQALQAGALAVLRKPGLTDMEAHANLTRTIRTMADVPVIHHWGHRANPAIATNIPHVRPPRTTESIKPILSRIAGAEVIGIAASTGGPGALGVILKDLPETFPLPILIVQHMSKGFDLGFTEWLGKQVKLEVTLASHGDRLCPGSIYVAPDDYHLEIPAKGVVILSKDPPYKGLRPSANSLFQGLAKAYGKHCLGLILTGMGDDGVNGLVELHQRGGFVIAQDEESSVVYGMPKEAVRRNAVDEVLCLEQIAKVLENCSLPR